MTKAEKRMEWKARFDAWKAEDGSFFETDQDIQLLAVDMKNESTSDIGDESIFYTC